MLAPLKPSFHTQQAMPQLTRDAFLHLPVIGSPLPQLKTVQINFAGLTAFERVVDQYTCLGVEFKGAIALHPSNPAFTVSPDALILMPTVQRDGIIINFCQPEQHVEIWITGTKPVTLTARSSQGKHLGQSSSCDCRVIVGKQDTLTLPQQLLCFKSHDNAPNITQVTLHSIAPFVLSELVLLRS